MNVKILGIEYYLPLKTETLLITRDHTLNQLLTHQVVVQSTELVNSDRP